MTNPAKVHPFRHDIECPKCGSKATLNPIYCSGKRGWFFNYWFKRCWVKAVQHLHVECATCKAWHVRACADIVSEIQRETGI